MEAIKTLIRNGWMQAARRFGMRSDTYAESGLAYVVLLTGLAFLFSVLGSQSPMLMAALIGICWFGCQQVLQVDLLHLKIENLRENETNDVLSLADALSAAREDQAYYLDLLRNLEERTLSQIAQLSQAQKRDASTLSQYVKEQSRAQTSLILLLDTLRNTSAKTWMAYSENRVKFPQILLPSVTTPGAEASLTTPSASEPGPASTASGSSNNSADHPSESGAN